jgi:hypothetical protein
VPETTPAYSVKSSDGQLSSSGKLSWSEATTLTNIQADSVTYTVTATPSLTDDTYSYTLASSSSHTVSVASDQTTDVKFEYVSELLPRASIEIRAKLPDDGSNAQLTCSTSGKTEVLLNLPSSGLHSLQVPLTNAVWTCVASTTDVHYDVSITPKEFLATSELSILYVVSTRKASGRENAALWAGWTGYSANLASTYSDCILSTLYLNQGEYSNGNISTASSFDMCKVPDADS